VKDKDNKLSQLQTEFDSFKQQSVLFPNTK